VQIFLEGKFLGIESFVLDGREDFAALAGRCLYVSLLSEAIPRALLAKLGLAPELLGSCGGGHFLAVIPSESLPEANAFLIEATRHLSLVSGRRLRLAWAATENLGAWSDVRKRLGEVRRRWHGLASVETAGLFEPFTPQPPSGYFSALYQGLPATSAAVWDPSAEGLLRVDGEPHWLATYFATADAGSGPASPAELAARARGRHAWGIVRGDVDQFEARLEKAQSVEEYIQLSVFYRQFFAGEVQVLCSRPEFATRLSVLYTAGDEFAVCGAWDALIPFARALQGLFERTVEEYLREFAGPEAKTLSMAIALAPVTDADPAAVYAEAGRQLEIAKSAGRDAIALFGRVLDWKALGEAADLKDVMLRLVDEFGCEPQFLGELGAFYRETDRTLPARSSRRMVETQQRPWRLHRRLNRVLEGPERNREFQKARNTLLAAFLTRGQGQLKLKASGRVALEWARITEEAE